VAVEPWLARWISPDSAGAVDGLNLYIYVGNNPLKYRDLTGHVKKLRVWALLSNSRMLDCRWLVSW
jgi:uncharacterized protein RhaS with RHS repeats